MSSHNLPMRLTDDKGNIYYADRERFLEIAADGQALLCVSIGITQYLLMRLGMRSGGQRPEETKAVDCYHCVMEILLLASLRIANRITAAEIKNRIYGMVLGGNAIHIESKAEILHGKLQYRQYLCCAPCETNLANVVRQDEGYHILASFKSRHQNCRLGRGLDTSMLNGPTQSAPWSTRLNLSFLRTCKQIHSEGILCVVFITTC